MSDTRRIVLDMDAGSLLVNGFADATECMKAARAIQVALGGFPLFFAPPATTADAPHRHAQDPERPSSVGAEATPQSQTPVADFGLIPQSESLRPDRPQKRTARVRSGPVLPYVERLASQRPNAWLSAQDVMEQCEALGWKNLGSRGADSVRRALDKVVDGGEIPAVRAVSRRDNRTFIYWLGDGAPTEVDA